MSFSPSPGDFGTIARNTTASQTFTLTKPRATLKGLAITLSGSSAFSITADSCSTRKNTDLVPKQPCSVTVQYAPTTDGASDTGTLTATSSKPKVVTTVPLTGASTARAPTVFSNTGPITLPAGAPNFTLGPADPYPSNITVSGMTGTITDVTVTLTGFRHTYPSDVGVLLVGPTGASIVLMNRAGGDQDVANLTFTFDAAATSSLLCAYVPLVSGTYLPNDCLPGTSWPAPAPPLPYGSLLSGFNGTNPNGNWSLYVIDEASDDVGSIDGGWSLGITAS